LSSSKNWGGMAKRGSSHTYKHEKRAALYLLEVRQVPEGEKGKSYSDSRLEIREVGKRNEAQSPYS